jgi:uncharacterized membrane protein YhaH (DUF805 family)
MDFVNIFITYSGRINRSKFWIGVLIICVINSVLVMTAFFAGRGTNISFIANITNLLVVISGFGVGVKRLHDRNKSGWFILLFLFLPITLFGIGERIIEVSDIAATVLWLVAIVISIWAFVELGCLRGTIGQNLYGPDPLAPEVLTPPVRTHA